MGFQRGPALVSNARKRFQCGSIGQSGAWGRAEGVFLGRSGGLWGMVAEVFG
jgi:hypothetical protein